MPDAAGSVPLPWHVSAKPELNLDLLRHILFFIEIHKNFLAAMLTCHAFYDAGIQPLIQLPVPVC